MLLAMIMCVLAVPSQANAETKTVTGNYAVLEGTTLTFRYVDSATSVTADAVYTGYDTAKYDTGHEAPWNSKSSTVIRAVFDASTKGKLRPASTARWFDGMWKLESIDGLGNLDTSKVTDMRRMFDGCSLLSSLDLSGFDTSKVTDMGEMFYYCYSLSSLNLSGFDTSSVTDMVRMFWGCRSLSSLDVSGFDTSSVMDMGYMFWGCSSLSSLDVSGFDTSHVTDMSYVFAGCSSLSFLDVSGFDTSSVTVLGGMFSGCPSLSSLDVSGFDTSHVTNMQSMFSGCSSLSSLDVSGFDTSHVTGMSWMFNRCSSLKTIRSSGDWSGTEGAKSSDNMFEGCTSLVGGNGTAYDENHVDAGYARVDRAGSPGYFTEAPDPTAAIAMHRLYNPNSGEHFYTASAQERDYLDKIGWNYEGIGWYAPTEGDDVYRLYNPNAGDHHYTMSASERDWLVSLGWRYEGVGWKSADKDGVPLYRQYNPNATTGSHNYTTSKSENDHLVSLGWRAEGIGWYGLPGSRWIAEQGHYEKVCTKDAWDEPVYETRSVCNGCGADFTNGGLANHLDAGCPSGGTGYCGVDVYVDTIHHEAVYENRYVVDVPAHWE